jgi:hypothetical protein
MVPTWPIVFSMTPSGLGSTSADEKTVVTEINIIPPGDPISAAVSRAAAGIVAGDQSKFWPQA